MTFCDHGINHAGERHGCDGCCRQNVALTLPEMRAAAEAAKHIQDFDAALAKYVVALNPRRMLALLDVADAAQAHLELHDHPNEALRMERKADSWARLRGALAKLPR